MLVGSLTFGVFFNSKESFAYFECSDLAGNISQQVCLHSEGLWVHVDNKREQWTIHLKNLRHNMVITIYAGRLSLYK